LNPKIGQKESHMTHLSLPFRLLFLSSVLALPVAAKPIVTQQTGPGYVFEFSYPMEM
jgi:hypothetical protein